MNPRRALHRWMTASVAVVAMLFAQIALANYLCPAQAGAEMAQTMAAGAPCEGMDPVQPVLCHQHAADASQSFEMAKLATPTLPRTVQVIVLPLLLGSANAVAQPFSDPPEARPPLDSVYLATLRLRV